MNAEFLLWALNLVLAVLGTFGFFAIRRLIAKSDEHSEKIEELRVLVAGDYVKWVDLDKVLARILPPITEHLKRIEDKLDGKVDKS